MTFKWRDGLEQRGVEGVMTVCKGAGWVRSGPLGSTITVYLERSDSILRRKANKLSAPLKQESEAAWD